LFIKQLTGTYDLHEQTTDQYIRKAQDIKYRKARGEADS